MPEKTFSWRGHKAPDIIAAAVLIVALIFVFLDRSHELLATASLNYSRIDYSKVTCVSIASHGMTVDGKDTPDPKLAKSITDILSVKTVLFGAAYSECPWDFSVHATSGAVLGVYDGNVNPQYLVSVSICERTDDVHVDQRKCLYKNVYVFNWRVKSHDLFRIALIGLKPETPDMVAITMRADSD